MISVLVVLCWLLAGHTAVTLGLPRDERHLAWRRAGMCLGPLWLFVRADGAPGPVDAAPAARPTVESERIAA